MPSLRRTFSSPSVRSSPYHHPPYPANPSSHATRQGGHGPRRSTGSETSRRRVLADLDWWRVQEGQRELRGDSPPVQDLDVSDSAELEQEQRPVVPDSSNVTETDVAVPLWHAVPGAGADAYENPFYHLSNSGLDSPPEYLSPLAQLAALSISPHTPSRRTANLSEDSQSSTDSTPAYAQLALSPMVPDMGFSDVVPPVDASPYSMLSRGPRRPEAPFGVRSFSYSFIEPELSINSMREHEALDDAFPMASPFFSRTMTDVDDLFC